MFLAQKGQNIDIKFGIKFVFKKQIISTKYIIIIKK